MKEQEAKGSPLAALFNMPDFTAVILSLVEESAELAILARVNREFCEIARRFLYGAIKTSICEYRRAGMRSEHH